MWRTDGFSDSYEEYVAIHGEPTEYLERMAPYSQDPPVSVIENEEPEIEPDTEGIIYEDKRGNMAINYGKFVDTFAEYNKLVCANGVFYCPDGVVKDDIVRNNISRSLMEAGWTGKLDAPTNSIYASMQDMHSVEEISAKHNVIPFANGDLEIVQNGKWRFYHNEKRHTPYRLSADFVPRDLPMPNFDKWLTDVFTPEDIPTIQEMIGYLMVPTTKAQEAFIIVGGGGVGKSVLGIILHSIFGNAFQPVITDELVTGKFQTAAIEHKLVAYDDDLGSAALTETGTLKKIVTADQPLKAERKYRDPHTFFSYAKLVACANFMLSSLYDDSDGFFRRLHPIVVKDKDPDREIIRDFGKLVASEREQIVRWGLKGLERLMANGWQITWSERSRNYLEYNKRQVNHFDTFASDTIDFDENGDITCAELIKLYDRWCKANAVQARTARKLYTWFTDNSKLKSTQHVPRDGKRVRGYTGCKMKDEWRP